MLEQSPAPSPGSLAQEAALLTSWVWPDTHGATLSRAKMAGICYVASFQLRQHLRFTKMKNQARVTAQHSGDTLDTLVTKDATLKEHTSLEPLQNLPTGTNCEEEGLRCEPGYVLPSLCTHITAWKQKFLRQKPAYEERTGLLRKVSEKSCTTRPSLSRISNGLNLFVCLKFSTATGSLSCSDTFHPIQGRK